MLEVVLPPPMSARVRRSSAALDDLVRHWFGRVYVSLSSAAHAFCHYVEGRVMWPAASSPLVAEPRVLVPAT